MLLLSGSCTQSASGQSQQFTEAVHGLDRGRLFYLLIYGLGGVGDGVAFGEGDGDTAGSTCSEAGIRDGSGESGDECR